MTELSPSDLVTGLLKYISIDEIPDKLKAEMIKENNISLSTMAQNSNQSSEVNINNNNHDLDNNFENNNTESNDTENNDSDSDSDYLDNDSEDDDGDFNVPFLQGYPNFERKVKKYIYGKQYLNINYNQSELESCLNYVLHSAEKLHLHDRAESTECFYNSAYKLFLKYIKKGYLNLSDLHEKCKHEDYVECD
jgi:hypothetical protein